MQHAHFGPVSAGSYGATTTFRGQGRSVKLFERIIKHQQIGNLLTVIAFLNYASSWAYDIILF